MFFSFSALFAFLWTREPSFRSNNRLHTRFAYGFHRKLLPRFRGGRVKEKRNENLFRSMAEHTPVMIWLSDIKNTRYYFNRSWLLFTGKSPGEMKGEGWKKNIHPDDLPRYIDSYVSAFEARQNFNVECRVRRFDGEYRWILDVGVPRNDAAGRFAGYIGSAFDISELKKTEETLRHLAQASEVLTASLDHETTLQNLARLTVPHFADWCIVDIQEETEIIHRLAVMHTDPEKARRLEELSKEYPPDPTVPDPVFKVLRTGQTEFLRNVPDSYLKAISRSDEQLKSWRDFGWKSVIFAPLKARGRTLGVITFAMSESERKYTESDLSYALDIARRSAIAVDNALLYRQVESANRAKDEFLAVVSHELRTPLTAILGWSQILNIKSHDESVRNRAIAAIQRNAKSQTKLINDLLDVSSIITGKVRLNTRPIQIAPAIESAVDSIRPAAEAKGISIQMQMDQETGLISGDPDRIQQVIWNLLSNAVKFTPRGGRIFVKLLRNAGQVDIQVSDTGEGIEWEFLPFVFDRFRQADSTAKRKYGGLGLGLSIVRHLVELHGGTVKVESAGRGQGAIFTLSFPIVKEVKQGVSEIIPRVKTQASEPCPPPGSLQQLRVLVVEDNQDTCEMLLALFKQCQAEVRPAYSAGEALEVFHEWHPEILVCDIGLPDESGYSLLQKIRSLSSDQGGKVPAIALTAYAGIEDRVRALSAGFQTHLSKPVEPGELISAVAAISGRFTHDMA